MQVTFKYHAQIRQAAATISEQVELPDGTELFAALKQLADQRGGTFRAIVLGDAGEVRPGLLVTVNDVVVYRNTLRELAAGDQVALLGPVGGG